MSNGAYPRSRKRDLLWFVWATALPVPWVVANAWGGLSIPEEVVAILTGLAIVGGAFILSWATELAERDVPQALALLVLALVSVLPEYAIDLQFAWKAGKDPSYAAYAVANMTGANRILIGLGWAAVVLIACHRAGTNELALDPRQRLEMRFLLVATLYSFFIPIDHQISMFDAFVLLSLFLAYVVSAVLGEAAEVELVGPSALIDGEFGDRGRRMWATLMLVFAAYAIFASAEPFAESLVHIGRNYAVDEFLLVQWIAPLASESPEFVIAILFAMRLRGSVGMGALISSKVNQWTLLVGAIPIAYAFSSQQIQGLPLDARQSEELWLTSAQSLFATVVICNLRFSRMEAMVIAGLFLGQFAFSSTEVRYWFILAYGAITLGLLLVGGRERRDAFFGLLAFWRPFNPKASE